MAFPNLYLARSRQAVLTLEDLPLTEIAAQFGTPTYVYSKQAITDNFMAYVRALAGQPHQICYAMKANSNLSILKLLAQLGAGFDIVSGGELARVLAIKADPKKIVFSGVGKSRQEIQAALEAGIGCFNIESASELEQIAQIAAAHGVRAPVSFRVNPDVDPKTHPYISTGLKDNKFGVAFEMALALYRKAADTSSIAVKGIDCHIGSQIIDPAPYMQALDKILDLVEALEKDGIPLHHVDLGGGLGITYQNEAPPSVNEFLQPILQRFGQRGHAHRTFMLEPGRSILGNAGLLLMQVQILKPGTSKNFCITDAAMNDYMRPALYQSYSEIVEVQPKGVPSIYDVVGPVCESGDWLGRDRSLAVSQGDLLALLSAGAYGMSMASNYNSRGRAAEVLVDGTTVHLIRRRETAIDQMQGETLVA